eukprot:comp18873_c0_seq1/m.34534 comp18873_c0_seq1/g.34534  ORF comp18873_c0_seq1/g.34534 comp18873_c0_seq1/m.34534 type:complete len:317 (-) comp18873_c0_seq1:453-1403(-)
MCCGRWLRARSLMAATPSTSSMPSGTAMSTSASLARILRKRPHLALRSLPCFCSMCPLISPTSFSAAILFPLSMQLWHRETMCPTRTWRSRPSSTSLRSPSPVASCASRSSPSCRASTIPAQSMPKCMNSFLRLTVHRSMSISTTSCKFSPSHRRNLPPVTITAIIPIPPPRLLHIQAIQAPHRRPQARPSRSSAATPSPPSVSQSSISFTTFAATSVSRALSSCSRPWSVSTFCTAASRALQTTDRPRANPSRKRTARAKRKREKMARTPRTPRARTALQMASRRTSSSGNSQRPRSPCPCPCRHRSRSTFATVC